MQQIIKWRTNKNVDNYKLNFLMYDLHFLLFLSKIYNQNFINKSRPKMNLYKENYIFFMWQNYKFL